MTKVRIPPTLREQTGGEREIAAGLLAQGRWDPDLGHAGSRVPAQNPT